MSSYEIFAIPHFTNVTCPKHRGRMDELLNDGLQPADVSNKIKKSRLPLPSNIERLYMYFVCSFYVSPVVLRNLELAIGYTAR